MQADEAGCMCREKHFIIIIKSKTSGITESESGSESGEQQTAQRAKSKITQQSQKPGQLDTETKAGYTLG